MFAFEGICLILPIGNSMKHPERFQATLTLAIIVTGAIFIIIGSIGYLTFGDKVEILVFLNMESSFVLSSVQMLYVLAIALTFPLAVYPAIRITESSAFGNKTGLKWTKNVYRAFLVSFLAFLSWAANNNLEKVVALVGCLCCIPLSFIYPTMYHIKIVDSKIIIFKDLVIIAFGVLACIYTTYITVKQWGESGAGEVSNRCQ